MKRLLIALVKFYRKYISPLKPPCCRFIPTCSEYALEALQKYGALKGSWLAIKRICRCHPFHTGEHEFYDPVPCPGNPKNLRIGVVLCPGLLHPLPGCSKHSMS